MIYQMFFDELFDLLLEKVEEGYTPFYLSFLPSGACILDLVHLQIDIYTFSLYTEKSPFLTC